MPSLSAQRYIRTTESETELGSMTQIYTLIHLFIPFLKTVLFRTCYVQGTILMKENEKINNPKLDPFLKAQL